jgi:hypothetical protein
MSGEDLVAFGREQIAEQENRLGLVVDDENFTGS